MKEGVGLCIFNKTIVMIFRGNPLSKKIHIFSGGIMKSANQRSDFVWSKSNSLFFVFIALLIFLVSGCGKEEVQEKREVIKPVKLMTVKDGTGVLTQGFPGTVRAARRAVLSFKVSGPLVKLPVDEGQKVKKGELIAQIDPRDFQIALQEAQASFREAEQQFRRYKELYAKKQVSKADFDRYRAARDVALARLDDARNALNDTTLRAPFDGVIAKRYVENFQKVRAKDPIVNLQDISEIEILVDVPELIMAELKEKSEGDVVVQFDSIPGKKFPLKVKEYSTEADPATQTYQVVFVMNQPAEANILPGMTASVTAKSSAAKSRPYILVPAIAVLDAPGNHPYVFVYDAKAGVVHKREVRIGRLQGSSSIHILDGLKPGEQIVTAGITKLEDGMKVRPWEKQREGK